MALDPRGLTADDLSDLIADSLRLKKIKAVLGATVAPSPTEIREAFTRINQRTEASVVRFKLDDFLAATQVPEEDLKKLYEERKGSLKTDEMRKVKLLWLRSCRDDVDKPLEGKKRPRGQAERLNCKSRRRIFAVAMTEKDAKFGTKRPRKMGRRWRSRRSSRLSSRRRRWGPRAKRRRPRSS